MGLGTFLGISILASIAVSVMYFIMKELQRIVPERRKAIIWLSSFVVGGIFMSIQTFLFYETADLARLSIGILAFGLMVPLLDQRIMIGASPFMVGSLFLIMDGDPAIFAYLLPILMSVILTLVFNNTNVIKSNGIKILITSILMILFTAAAEPLRFTGETETYDLGMITLASISFTTIATLIISGSNYLFEKIFGKYYSLEESVVKDEFGFIRLAKVNETFRHTMDSRRISYGLFYIFELEDTSNIEELSDSLYLLKDKMLLNITTEQSAIFIPLENLNDLSKEIKKTNAIIKKSLSNLSNFKLSLIVYGKDENNFVKLIQEGISFLPDEYDNNVHRYDFKKIKSIVVKKSKSAELFEYIDNVKINHIASNKTNDLVYYSEYTLDDIELKDKLKELNKTERAIVWKNISLKSLKELDEEVKKRMDRLVINYSLFSFDENFNTKEFISKIKKFFKKEIIISILSEDFIWNEEVKTIIKELRKLGIEFNADNVEDWNLANLSKLKPEYIKSKEKWTFKKGFADLTDLKEKIEEKIGEVKEI